jgi:hypothetical protein
MKRLGFLLVLGCLVCGTTEALLPPLFQTADEIKSILGSQELSQHLHAGEVIVTIQRNDKGYEIITNQHRLQVDLGYEPNLKPGPAQFKLTFHEPVNLLHMQ